MTPVYLLTGFLGSGKTTLLRELLAQRAARGAEDRLGVVINEFGAIGIDAELLGGQDPRRVELAGGCVCCVLGPELGQTLRDLLAADPAIGAIVLETSGAAEPLPIAWALEADDLASVVRLAAIITVVDAGEFGRSREVSPAVAAQVRAADVVVLSKLDVAATGDAAAARAALAELAPRAPVLDGGHAAAAAWLDGVVDDPERAPAVVGARLSAGRPSGHGIASVALDVEPGAVLDLEELEDALAALPTEVVRIKGILLVVDGRRGHQAPHWAEVHRVGLRLSSAPLPPLAAGAAPRRARLVALGARVEAQALRDAVLACTQAP